MENKLDLLPLLDYIDPSVLDYQEWVNVGMALKAEGYSVSVWDDWYKTTEYIRQTGKNWKRLEIPGSLVMMLDSGIFYWEI